jgi:oxazoline/thiazoline synthase
MRTTPDDEVILRWNAGLVPLIGSDGSMSLILEHRQFRTSDPLLIQLTRLLQQPQSLDALIEQCQASHDPAAVKGAVEHLCLEGVVVASGPYSLKRSSAAFWDIVLSDGTFEEVRVHSQDRKFEELVKALLEANGVPVRPEADLIVVVTNDYLDRELAHLAASQKAVLPAKPVGNEVWIGPCLSPETSLCWDCLAYWLRLRRWPEFSITGKEHGDNASCSSIASLPSTINLALGLIATATTLWSAQQTPDVFAKSMWAFDLHTFEMRAHPVLARRNCPICTPRNALDVPSLFDVLHNSKFGIMDRLHLSKGKVGSVHLAHCGVLLPLPRLGERDLAPPLSADGKGSDAEEAVLRCTMEAVERYSSVFTGHEPTLSSRGCELDSLSVESILLFSEAQLDAREQLNQRPGGLHGVPERFDHNRPTRWVPARPLFSGSERFVPVGYSHLWYPFRGEPIYNYADTNGCAAGETRVDATLRGLLELIERDALAIWWYNRLRRPGIDLSIWDDLDVQAAVWLFAEQGRSVSLLNLTHDLEIPVFAAVSADENGRDIYFGCAADFCAVTAAKRALAELIQFWYWAAILGVSSDRESWLKEGLLDRHLYLVPFGRATQPEAIRINTEEALTMCLRGLERAGVNAYAVDLTKPELGVPVVRVVAPGLRHYGPRFAPGRLYDVPVKLGWLKSPLTEDEMNPEPCVL